jgi:hypothetical protein
MPRAATFVLGDKVALVTGPSASGLAHNSAVALTEHGVAADSLRLLALPFITVSQGKELVAVD